MLQDSMPEWVHSSLYPPADIPRAIRVLTISTQRSLDGLNTRYVQVARDGQTIETGVFDHRSSPDLDGDNHLIICLSIQIGCERACPFCASGAPKDIPEMKGKVRLIRNLTTQEITDQVINAVELSGATQDESRLLFSYMGMGEPLDNWDNVVSSIHNLANRFPNRSRVTLSTICSEENLPKLHMLAKMIKLGEFAVPVKMHFSLHGPDDETRRRLVPQGVPVQVLLDTARDFARVSGSRVKLNYVLVAGRNDSLEHAQALTNIVSAHPVRDVATIKISQLNPWGGYISPGKEVFEVFKTLLSQAGLSVTRFSSAVDGAKVDAGCGQLRKRTLDELIG